MPNNRETIALLYNESGIYCIAIMLLQLKSEHIHLSYLALNNKDIAANVCFVYAVIYV